MRWIAQHFMLMHLRCASLKFNPFYYKMNYKLTFGI